MNPATSPSLARALSCAKAQGAGSAAWSDGSETRLVRWFCCCFKDGHSLCPAAEWAPDYSPVPTAVTALGPALEEPLVGLEENGEKNTAWFPAPLLGLWAETRQCLFCLCEARPQHRPAYVLLCTYAHSHACSKSQMCRWSQGAEARVLWQPTCTPGTNVMCS